jgi:nitroreductase
MSNVKIPVTSHPVMELIKNRWSPRSFSTTPISPEDINSILEAARWSLSANNEQPWRFIVASKNTEAFGKVLSTLMPGNTPWAKNAAAFIVSIAKTTFDREGAPVNTYAEYDSGLANAMLILQAQSMNIYSHTMAGFDKAGMKEAFHLDENLKPLTVIALGYLDDADKLEEPYLSRELSPRVRKLVKELVLNEI